MGNVTNRDQWAARERLRFIERQAWWKATVNRRDLQELFGISAAQASADLQAYQETNPTSLLYNLRAKRYEAQPNMSCVFHVPRLEEALSLFLGDTANTGMVGKASDTVGRVLLPLREPEQQVARRIFVATDGLRRVSVRYWSVHSKRAAWREVAPHAFGYDGYRWHSRAWCFENNEYRDFVLSRIEEAEWPGKVFTPPKKDADWQTIEEVVLRPWSGLSEEQQLTISRDYGMTRGKLRVAVRRALKPYLLAHLRSETDEALPRHLEVHGPRAG